MRIPWSRSGSVLSGAGLRVQQVRQDGEGAIQLQTLKDSGDGDVRVSPG